MVFVAVLILLVTFGLVFEWMKQESSKGGTRTGRERLATGKRTTFKALYGLDTRQAIGQFEGQMLEGMASVRNEVWVTAFCRDDIVLRVFANVGSRYRVHPTEDLSKWPDRAYKLDATEIRQYHSHPQGVGCSLPSDLDITTHDNLRRFVEQYNLTFKSFLVYPDWPGGMKITPYS